MKNLFLILSFTVIFIKVAYGQADSVMLKKMKINFAIPDVPAQKLIGGEPSKLLRPSTPEAISMVIPQFVQSSSFVIPQAFAAEVAPFILMKQNKKIDINKYIKNQLVNSIRLSVATGRDTTDKKMNASKLGIGLRFAIINKGDLKTDRDALIMLAKALEGNLKIEDEAIEIFSKKKGLNTIEFEEKRESDATFKKEFETFLKDFKERKDVNKLIEDYKKDNWNATKLDFAFAFLAVSKDSLVRNLKKESFSMWLSGAFPVKTWGQFLCGLNYTQTVAVNKELQKTFNNEWTLSARVFAGNNEIKGFIEAQGQHKSLNNENSFFAYAGGELAITNGIWLNLYAGIKTSSLNAKPEVVSNIDFRFTLPSR